MNFESWTLCPNPRTPGPCVETAGTCSPTSGPCFPNTGACVPTRPLCPHLRDGGSCFCQWDLFPNASADPRDPPGPGWAHLNTSATTSRPLELEPLGPGEGRKKDATLLTSTAKSTVDKSQTSQSQKFRIRPPQRCRNMRVSLNLPGLVLAAFMHECLAFAPLTPVSLRLRTPATSSPAATR